MLKVECPHNVKTELDLEPVANVRWIVRELLLACPQCRRENDGMLEEMGT